MRLRDGLHLSRLIVIAILATVVVLITIYKNDAKQIVGMVLGSDLLMGLCLAYAIVAVLAEQLYLPEKRRWDFNRYLNFVGRVSGNALLTSGSLILVDGVFMQLSLGKNYFPSFDKMDMACIVVVASYLLIHIAVEATGSYASIIVKARAEPIGPEIK